MTARLKEHLELAESDQERIRMLDAIEEVLSRLELEVVEHLSEAELKEKVRGSFQKYMYKLHNQREDLEKAVSSVA